MSAPGRPKGKCRRAQPEATPVNLFNRLLCELPLPDGGAPAEFLTKSLRCEAALWRITRGGRLVDGRGADAALARERGKLAICRDIGRDIGRSMPESIALPAGQRTDATSMWQQRVLLQSDPDHLDRLLGHLLAALPAQPSPSRSFEPTPP